MDVGADRGGPAPVLKKQTIRKDKTSMTRTLYLDGSCGISGDMTVAALLDLGADRAKLDAALQSLRLNGFDYTVSRKKSYGIAGCDFDVVATESHGHHHHHQHGHRNLADVHAIIDQGKMTERGNELAKKIFRIVAEAESKAHGCPVEEIHFHEVGAIDSIVDIVAAAVLLDDLGVADCVVTGFSEGAGFVRCQHGDLPVPVPAVLNIAQAYGIPLRPTGIEGEMVTPTGIAIAAAIRTKAALPKEYRVERSGVGLGKRDFGRANFLRAMILAEERDPEQVFVVECNIDDAIGATLGLAMDALMNAGARDVHFIPCFMKKNRPAYLLRIIVTAALLPEIEATVFRTTTTIGLRKSPVERTCLARETLSVSLPFGDVQVKKCSLGELVRIYPEYESVKKVSEESGLDFHTVFEEAKRKAESEIGFHSGRFEPNNNQQLEVWDVARIH